MLYINDMNQVKQHYTDHNFTAQFELVLIKSVKTKGWKRSFFLCKY